MRRRNLHHGVFRYTLGQEVEGRNETGILLITVTVLFGVIAQIIEKITVSNHPMIWFSFEVATVMLLSSMIYSMASWRAKGTRKSIYQQISASQMIVTTGLLVSILLFYIGDELAQSQPTTTFFKNIDQGYPIVTLLGFVLLPLGVYAGSIGRTIELIFTLFGGYTDPRDEEAGVIAGFLSIMIMFAIIFSIGASGVSKTISIVALVILVIILPYISVLMREKLYRETRKRDRIILYILNSYSIYFTALFVSSIMDISEIWSKGISDILTSITSIYALANVVLLMFSFISIRNWKTHKNTGYITTILIMVYGIVSALFLIKDINTSLTGFMMFFYVSAILTVVVLPVVLTNLIATMFKWAKRKIFAS